MVRGTAGKVPIEKDISVLIHAQVSPASDEGLDSGSLRGPVYTGSTVSDQVAELAVADYQFPIRAAAREVDSAFAAQVALCTVDAAISAPVVVTAETVFPLHYPAQFVQVMLEKIVGRCKEGGVERGRHLLHVLLVSLRLPAGYDVTDESGDNENSL